MADPIEWARAYVANLISPQDGMATANAINQGKSLEDTENRNILGVGPNDAQLNAQQLQAKIESLRAAEKVLPHQGNEIDWTKIEQSAKNPNNPYANNTYVNAVEVARGFAILRNCAPIQQSSAVLFSDAPNLDSYKQPEDSLTKKAENLWELGVGIASIFGAGRSGPRGRQADAAVVTAATPANPVKDSSPKSDPSVVFSAALRPPATVMPQLDGQ